MRRTLIVTAAASLALAAAACNDSPMEIEEEDPLCSTFAAGGLSQATPCGPFTYATSGNGSIVIDRDESISIGHESYANLEIEFWGLAPVGVNMWNSGNHENLNGKHIKDRFGSRRTIVFPDGAKITMIAEGEQGALLTVSIYDGNESHRIDMRRATVTHSSTTQSEATQLDAAEADGETGTFRFTETGLIFENIYIEDSPGDRVPGVVPLGELTRDNPNQVKDFFDDPRIGST